MSPPSYLNPTDGSYALASSAVSQLDDVSELAPTDELLLERGDGGVHTSSVIPIALRTGPDGPTLRPDPVH